MQRARAYLISSDPLGIPLPGRDWFGCNCYSSGEAVNTECIMPTAYRSMLGFFQLVADVPGYQEVEDVELTAAKEAVNGNVDGDSPEGWAAEGADGAS